MKKKVLWITDDHKHAYWNIRVPEVKVDIIDEIKFCPEYSLVFIDYGLMGDVKENINVLQDYYFSKIPVIWTGGYGQRYSAECPHDFPTHKFLHKIEAIDLENMPDKTAEILKLDERTEDDTTN